MIGRRKIGIGLVLGLLLAGCGGNVRPCRQGTVLLQIDLVGVDADELGFIATAGGVTRAEQRQTLRPGTQQGTVEVRFDHYPPDSFALQVKAYKGGALVGSGAVLSRALAAGCETISVTVTGLGQDLSVVSLDLGSADLVGIDAGPDLSTVLDLTVVMDLAVPDLAGSDLTMLPGADMATPPDLKLPDLTTTVPPDQTMSAMDLTGTTPPDLRADLALPDLAMPDLALPDLALPDLSVPDLAVPDLAMPDLAMPDQSMPDMSSTVCTVLPVVVPCTSNCNWAKWPMPNPVSSGLPHPMSYTVLKAGPTCDDVVKDNVTGLLWQRTVSPTQRTWDNAKVYCANLSLGGVGPGGWRLPTRIELTSILDLSQSTGPINPTAFPATPSDYFWTSTESASLTTAGWRVLFFNADGEVAQSGKANVYYARCVR